jgi:hypothetical protein
MESATFPTFAAAPSLFKAFVRLEHTSVEPSRPFSIRVRDQRRGSERGSNTKGLDG